jgi:uncharacterized RDD family membrane protein YckC
MAPVSYPPQPPGSRGPDPIPPGQWQPPPAYRPLPPALAPNGQPLAPFFDRFLAILIDYAIYIAVSLLWSVPFMIWWFFQISEWMNEFSRAYDPADPYAQPPVLEFGDFLQLYLPMLYFALASTALGVIYTYIYWVEYQYRKGGQTFGKRSLKIRVIPADPGAAPLDRRAYVRRWAVQCLVGIVVPLFSLLDGLWQLWDKPLQQCLHDKAAKTVVVKVG